METGWAKSLSALFHSLSFKLFLLFFLIISSLFTLYVTLCSRYQRQIFKDTVQLSAFRSGDIVMKSLYQSMLANDRQRIDEMILTIGSEPGVERIRIYDKKGEIKFSTDRREQGQQVDMGSEACYACHNVEEPFKVLPVEDKARIFQGAGGHRIMGLIIPVSNAAECSNDGCHAHDPDINVLGVLDVQMSLAELDQAMASAKQRVFLISVIFLLGGAILIAAVVYLTTYRPIKTLRTGTERLAAGDMAHRIPLKRRDELGMLADSFNNMAANLKVAYDNLRKSSQVLEEKVQEKTAELEEIHREMLQVERITSLGKMAASVAHELNNPLSGIVNYAKLLQRKIKRGLAGEDNETEKILEQLELIRAESLRCGDIVKNLLLFARGATVNFKKSRLKEIVNRAMSLVEHHIRLAGIEKQVDIAINPQEIVCDPDQIVQALVALLVNAVQAMPGGGKLAVGAHNSPQAPDKILLTVSDTGMGIPEEIRDKIFEPFYSNKSGHEGVGLGLAVVYGIVQRHKAKIWVESEKGKGTTFYIELPVDLSD